MDMFDQIFLFIANAALTLINVLLIRHSNRMSELHVNLINQRLGEMYGQDK